MTDRYEYAISDETGGMMSKWLTEEEAQEWRELGYDVELLEDEDA